MAFSRSLSLGSECESTSSSDDFDWEIEEKFQNFWGDPKKIDAMKRIWTSSDSEVFTQTQKSPLWVEKSTLAITNVIDTRETRFSYSKVCEYGQLLLPGFVSTGPTFSASDSGNDINTRHTLPVKTGSPVGGTFNPFGEMKDNLGQLVECFMVLESLDRDIKTCEKMLSITSLDHPVALPGLYNVKEVQRLLGYSETQLVWYNKFAEHVETRFVWEEQRMDAGNEMIALFDGPFGGIVWNKGSFENLIFSNMISIAQNWSLANQKMSVLLKENGKQYRYSNLRLFPIYFHEVSESVLSAKMSVWALMKKIKIMKISALRSNSHVTTQHLTAKPIPSSSCTGASKSKVQSLPTQQRQEKNTKKFQRSI